MTKTFFALTVALGSTFLLPCRAQEVIRDEKRMVTGIKYLPIDGKFLNPTSKAEEAAWWERVRTVLRADVFNANGTFKPGDSRTFGESEKSSYPAALWAILAGEVPTGMKVLEAEDEQAKGWNAYTEGIDLWFGFTVQGQVAKYYFTRPLMTPAYRQRMDQAIKIWTATDPQHTPHPMFGKYNPALKDGWGPDRFGDHRVDVRRTDAMWSFTCTAIYLFAEASGNEATRLGAKDEILRYVWSLYNVGMGEWDSSTYLPYSVAPYLNLHAYAKDPDVRMAAKLALDYYHTAAALKYRHGLFTGPSKRDYGNAYQMYAGAFNGYFPMIFGDAHGLEKAKEQYSAYAMISPYRPAPTMLALARRQLPKSVEVLSTKPAYENWTMTGTQGPSFFETLFLAKNYDLGSVVSRGGDGDVAPFRLVFDKGADEAELFTANSGPHFAEKYTGDSIGQYRNLLVWVSPASDKGQFTFALPSRMPLAEAGGWSFADAGKNWIALHTFGLDPIQPEQSGASKDQGREKAFGTASFHVAKRQATSAGGFALIVAEQGDYPSFEAFKQATTARAKLDVSKLADKIVRLTGPDGAFVSVKQTDTGFPEINRNGEARDWNDSKNWKLWQTVGGDLVSLGWKEGALTLNGGGTFTGTVGLPGWQKPDASPKDLETAKGLTLTAGFSNK